MNSGLMGSRYPPHSSELFGKLPITPVSWLAPLSLRESFIVDEIVVWFIERVITSNSFHWNKEDCIEVVRTLWEKRIPLSGQEVSRVMCAHGLPSERQDEFEFLFDFATKTLMTQSPRKLIKKKRLSGFENINKDPQDWAAEYILPFI